MNNTIFVFGFSENEMEKIKVVFGEKKFEVIQKNEAMDLIVNFACATFISSRNFTQDDWEKLCGAYEDIDVFSEVMVFVGKPNFQATGLKRFTVCSDFDEFMARTKYFVLEIKKKERKRHTFSSTISLAIQILAEIQNNPGITTNRLAEKFEVSQRTIQRNIETLRMSGEAMVKEPTTKGWMLEFDESLLLIDVLPVKDSIRYFDSVFSYREILRDYLVDCGLSQKDALELSERVRKGYLYRKEYSHPQIPKKVTDWFSYVKYLPSVRRLLQDEEK